MAYSDEQKRLWAKSDATDRAEAQALTQPLYLSEVCTHSSEHLTEHSALQPEALIEVQRFLHPGAVVPIDAETTGLLVRALVALKERP